MKNLFFVLFLSAVTLSSCKKEGCTNPLADNYDSGAKKDDGSCIISVNPNTAPLCAGISGNNKYLPIAAGYKWTYSRVLAGNSSLYSEEIVSTEDINGLSYFKVFFVNNQLGTDGNFHYRIDASTGDVYKRGSDNVDVLYILGNPTANASVGAGMVTNVNATITTTACTYTGCIEVSETSTLGTKKTYFKKGLGVVKMENAAAGSDVLTGVAF